ncbi:Intraflagellar transport protein 25 [Hondaea fermentalgiana]|uniref:Intraflagellar transport protein 25 n=1 Tax=Hondaea fermentalgiana TaxID=2315210 RepID=A0A2R5G2U6_9STRA|nr:Intraflagellar transport protein 25 [Hondaea fermentalgiana]|eukprot:GBG25330.1 Intraflagellar transport protein 25 [Hondaea fermentalgiana]
MGDERGPLGPGATVMAPTSVDPAHPPHNILDSDDRYFWMTTGLFPQEVVISLDGATSLDRISLRTTNVQKVAFLASTESSTPTEWETIAEASLADADGRIQMETISVERAPHETRHIKLQILKGWDDFCAVHSLEIN